MDQEANAATTAAVAAAAATAATAAVSATAAGRQAQPADTSTGFWSSADGWWPSTWLWLLIVVFGFLVLYLFVARRLHFKWSENLQRKLHSLANPLSGEPNAVPKSL